ncbi:hypothetical protein C8A03DRAFT_39750, partial [Achaetomium macrosporum]
KISKRLTDIEEMDYAQLDDVSANPPKPMGKSSHLGSKVTLPKHLALSGRIPMDSYASTWKQFTEEMLLSNRIVMVVYCQNVLFDKMFGYHLGVLKQRVAPKELDKGQTMHIYVDQRNKWRDNISTWRKRFLDNLRADIQSRMDSDSHFRQLRRELDLASYLGTKMNEAVFKQVFHWLAGYMTLDNAEPVVQGWINMVYSNMGAWTKLNIDYEADANGKRDAPYTREKLGDRLSDFGTAQRLAHIRPKLSHFHLIARRTRNRRADLDPTARARPIDEDNNFFIPPA